MLFRAYRPERTTNFCSVDHRFHFINNLCTFFSLPTFYSFLKFLFYPQFNLFGGTVLKLGTERHHKKLLAGIDTLDDVGCFGLTELGYGNNAVEMETTAVYDKATGTVENRWIILTLCSGGH